MKSLKFGRFAASLLAIAVACVPTTGSTDEKATSRVYVIAYPCPANRGVAVVAAGDPVVDLYDQAFYGDSGKRTSIKSPVTVTKATTDTVEFYFDVYPGNYDAFIRFPTSNPKAICSRNGPLIVLPGRDRHLFVATIPGFSDWHAAGAVAGTLPMKGAGVSVLVYDRQMHCGDNVRSFDPKTFKPTVTPHVGNAVIDDGAYYENIHAYGKQDHTIALEISGALFTRAAILLTITPETDVNKPPFIEKDITANILHAATETPFTETLVCIPGL
jgi:hypothetical protein